MGILACPGTSTIFPALTNVRPTEGEDIPSTRLIDALVVLDDGGTMVKPVTGYRF